MDGDEQETRTPGMRKKQRDTFSEDLTKILFAFGDHKQPREETVKVLEEYLLFFLDKLVSKVQEKNPRKEGATLKITKEDVILAFRSDPKWLARVAYMVQRKKEIDKISKDAKETKEGKTKD